jgi:hypothetical protein
MIRTKAASDEYRVVLEPLPPGELTIEARVVYYSQLTSLIMYITYQ